MCGFVGSIDRQYLTKYKINKLHTLLNHRGPDGEGIEINVI